MTVNELFATVAPLPFNAGDWFAEENKQHLDRLIAERHVGDAIEVGSWLGLSSRFIAERVKGTLYCIDPWERRPFCAAHLDKQGVTDFFRQFLSNCIHAKLTHKIVPIRMLSHEAAECFRFHADLIYVDGMHDEFNVARDIKAWVPHLNGGGVICGAAQVGKQIQKPGAAGGSRGGGAGFGHRRHLRWLAQVAQAKKFACAKGFFFAFNGFTLLEHLAQAKR